MIKRISKIPHQDIAYLEANINYTIFHLCDGKKVISGFTLKRHAAAENLSQFLRVHKSYLLNPEYVNGIEREGSKAVVTMQDGTELQVSRRKRSLLADF